MFFLNFFNLVANPHKILINIQFFKNAKLRITVTSQKIVTKIYM